MDLKKAEETKSPSWPPDRLGTNFEKLFLSSFVPHVDSLPLLLIIPSPPASSTLFAQVDLSHFNQVGGKTERLASLDPFRLLGVFGHTQVNPAVHGSSSSQ